MQDEKQFVIDISYRHDWIKRRCYWRSHCCIEDFGTAIVGLLLDFSGFKGTLTVQPDSAINMLHIMYLIVPFTLDLIITFILSKMNVEKANAEIKEKLGIS